MRLVGWTSTEVVTIEVTKQELVLFYGGLVEAMEALSAAEFHARLGIRAEAATPLLAALRSAIAEFAAK